jgi:spermidine/putrescine transport system ATP-binding protein
MTMSNRLAVMRHGKIEQIGPPESVYESPASEFVAGFLGASNLLEGRVLGVDGEFGTVEVPGGSIVRVSSARLEGHGPTVKVGVRPEKITLDVGADDRAASDDWNAVAGTLRVTTFVGVSHQYTVDGPGGTTLTVYAQNLGAGEAPPEGSRVRLLWRPQHTFVVQPSTPLADWEEDT